MMHHNLTILTVVQPWAWALLHGKDVENRTWFTPYRGRLYIHAGKAKPEVEEIAAVAALLPDVRTAELYRGAIVGSVDLYDVRRNHRSPWAAPGAWHWLTRSPVELKRPVPVKGKLRLWTMPGDIVERHAQERIPVDTNECRGTLALFTAGDKCGECGTPLDVTDPEHAVCRRCGPDPFPF